MADPITDTKKNPSATAAAGSTVKKFRALREFVDSHGARWAKGAMVSISEEDAKAALEAGDVEEHDAPAPGVVVPSNTAGRTHKA